MQNKKKILFVLPTLNGGGAERVACNLMNQLDRNKFDVGFFVYTNEGDYWNLLRHDICIHISQKGTECNKIKVLLDLIRVSSKYDIIVGAMELMPTYLSVIAGLFNKKKTVGWVHINMTNLLKGKNRMTALLHRIFIPFFYQFLDKIILVSEAAKTSFSDYIFKSSRKKMICIYNPIDLSAIRAKSNEGEIHHYFGKPKFIAVGRLENQKNYPLMIEAFKLFIRFYPEAKLYILGQGSEEQILKEKVERLHLEKNVFFLGFKDNPYLYIKNSDALILSSKFEGLPTVLIEALILHTPIVSVDCPDGVKEILAQGKYGLIVDNYDSAKLCEGMKQIFENKKMVLDFKNRAEEAIKRFSFDEIIGQFNNVFKEVLNK